VIRESGGHGLGDVGEPAAWPNRLSSRRAPPTASSTGGGPASRDRARAARGDPPERPHADGEPAAHPVRRAALRSHVALRHLPPRSGVSVLEH
jgi:hypothetical protein